MIEHEEWRPAPVHGDRYAVSSWGRVRSRRGHLLSQSMKAKGGYLMVQLSDGRGYGERHYVHRLVLTAFLGPCPSGMQTRHLDGRSANNRVDNLVWGTPAENSADRSALVTHCPAGHPYTPENTYVRPSRNSRICRACKRKAPPVPRPPAEDVDRALTLPLPDRPRQDADRAPAPPRGRPRQDRCGRGHPLFGENLYLRPNGARECATCRAAANAARRRTRSDKDLSNT